ncbi:MAG: acyl-CoA dehydrogenase family protein [Chloroflexota bacterium]|nr:acyl-CoA dehydrogenase family protein [Chloroflexota bacterium]
MNRDEILRVLVRDEELFMRDAVRAYVEAEIMPVRHLIDDDEDHVLIRRLLQGLADIGLQASIWPERYGGAGLIRITPFCLCLEELARGDGGIAVSASCSLWPFLPAIWAQNQVVIDRFAPEFCGEELRIGCFALTEPGGAAGGGGCDIENPALQGRLIGTRARLEGEEWVLDGQKMWASNGGVADVYLIACTTDPELGDEGLALIYVPGDTEGLSFGQFERKAGVQADRNCAIYLEGVRVPKGFRAAGHGRDARLFHQNLVVGRLGSAAISVGNAQAAFEIVLEFTAERVVAGRPIREHSVGACMLADMAIGIESARSFYLQAAHKYDHPEDYGPQDSTLNLSRASAAKVYASEVAVMVANKAMELMGSYGYTHDYHLEKYWRDGKIMQLWLGGAQLGRLDVVRGYYAHSL